MLNQIKGLKVINQNVKNGECKDQSLDDIPEQINVPITKVADS